MKPLEKWALLSSGAATALTGVIYAWMRYFMQPVDEFAVINHPLEPWVLKAHILVAPLLLFAVGMVALSHIWKHFRSRVRQGRRSGVLTAAVFVPMVWSGYLIQSVTSPGWLRALVAVHLVTSGLFVVGFALHWREFLRRGRSPAERRASRVRDLSSQRSPPIVGS